MSSILRLLTSLIPTLYKGSIINVPTAKTLLGGTYTVGDKENIIWGKALSIFEKRGLLDYYSISHTYHGKSTTIHNWKVI